MQALQDRHLIDPRAGIATLGAAAVFAAGIVLGTLIDPDAATLGSPAAVPAGDGSYDAVEETRADRGLSAPVGSQNFDALRKIHAARGTD